MPQICYSVSESYSTKQLFDLVNDINAYSQFVPDCIHSGILSQQDNVITAFIEVEKLGIRKRFITKNTLIEHTKIMIELVDGPFSRLSGYWSFTPLDDQRCNIGLNLNFEFKSKLIELAFSRIFKEIMTNMVDAFSKRAKQVYGD
ncbi:type II toxin-antitoxin system RatA family toxin [Utexia brackfieldae]|uniref:type II toxin-antitoxin system RatA family toxin n=1 Tax=Utexia brackfieldae TaxID=3074108 RepID=UPI00370D2F07